MKSRARLSAENFDASVRALINFEKLFEPDEYRGFGTLNLGMEHRISKFSMQVIAFLSSVPPFKKLPDFCSRWAEKEAKKKEKSKAFEEAALRKSEANLEA